MTGDSLRSGKPTRRDGDQVTLERYAESHFPTPFGGGHSIDRTAVSDVLRGEFRR